MDATERRKDKKESERQKERQREYVYIERFNHLGFKRMDLQLLTLEEYRTGPRKGGRYIAPIPDVLSILNDISNKIYSVIRGNNGIYDIFYFFNDENTEESLLSKFWANGSNTAVFSIDDIRGDSYVLKLQKFRRDDIEEYISLFQHNYERDFKLLLRENCPKIYSCGKLTKKTDAIEDGTEIFYSIMHKYNTFFTTILSREKNGFEKSFEILIGIVYRLMKLHHFNFYLRDLKYENIGFTEEYKPIFIDYDPYLCQRFSTSTDITPDTEYISNTFYPYYFMRIGKYYENKNISLNREIGVYNHIEAMGLADIILILFFKPLISIDHGSYYMLALYTGGIYRYKTGEKIALDEIIGQTYNIEKSSNIKNIDTIKKFTDFLKILYTNHIHAIFSENLRKILFNSVGTKGLMHTEYRKIYTYAEIYDLLIKWKKEMEQQQQQQQPQKKQQQQQQPQEKQQQRPTLQENINSDTELLISVANDPVLKTKQNSIGGKKYKIILNNTKKKYNYC
jgi:hypothetical protein